MKKIIMIIGICIGLMGISIYTSKPEKKEISVYTAQDTSEMQETLKDFEKKYPDIKLNIVRGSTGNITSKLLLEKGNPQCDVIWNVPASSLIDLDKEGVLESYKPKELHRIDRRFYDTKSEMPKWVGTSLWTGVITVNTEELEKKNLPMPTGYEDITKDIYKKEIVMPDPIASGTGYLMVNSWIQNWNKPWEFIDSLDKNIKYYTPSGSAPTKSTAIGEQAIALSFDKTSLKMEKDVEQLKTIYPKEGVPWEVEAIALVKKSNMKEEAKIFYEWAMSEEVMNIYLKTRTITTDGNVSPEVPKDYKNMLSENNLYWAAEEKKNICDEWTKRYSERD
ncbi:MAG: extracellular solute-binding protein [Clostridium sp.]|uniref:extracellular solute-binding protein n=1 Tax=Clostridium sp. TaxID=1506 RepID=UPI003F2C7A0A